MEDRSKITKKANLYFFSKVVINLLLVIIGAVLIGFFLRDMQHKVALQNQEENSRSALAEVFVTLEDNLRYSSELTEIYHNGNQETLKDLQELLQSGLFDSIGSLTTAQRTELFRDVVNRSGVQYLFLLDDNGRIVLTPELSYAGKELVTLGLLTTQQLHALLSGTMDGDGRVEPVHVTNTDGDFYFYSAPISAGKNLYSIVLGENRADLDVQLQTLKDIGQVLKRAAVANEGFLFAVDKQTNAFVYYEDGNTVLTGCNAVEYGLSEDALVDGYTGMQTLNGVRYYCVSRVFQEQTVISAVAETDTVFVNDRYVLFWSILGFVLVMLLCLTYAVIVRNDFVRKSVETERKELFSVKGNPIIFDHSIFKKIFPLMLTGVLVIFAISFYAQTLLSISVSISDSVTALDDVVFRFEENTDSRNVIRNYYENRFLSKAQLLSYLLEEDPAPLNAPTDRFYSTYDADGTKRYLLDDEGNRLSSVSASTDLAALCRNNEIKNIYLYDENGRVIATSSDDWHFALSFDPAEQSYEFRQVLDGQKDTFVQQSMVSDRGEMSQYIGVAFHYYTTVDAEGNTRYVSRYDYERYLSSAKDAQESLQPITAHRSLLQIELDSALAGKLFATTDVSYVLSSDMLSGGFIVLFDSDEAHTCLYSPNESSIGKTAAELGVSDNAFGGTYYGFQRVNGERYFQHYRYAQGYYIGTAIKTVNMYAARFPVALITALTSLVVILILSATVTLTSREEEYLYASMSDAQTHNAIDAAIFTVILPSGHARTTTRAASRWDNKRIKWEEHPPEQKLILLIQALLGILILYMLISVIWAERIYTDDSIIRYILSGTWDRGMNIFALSACAVVLVFTFIAVHLFRIPVRIVTSLFGTRSETVGHLLLSVVEYGGALAAVFYCLYLLGLDSTSLLASAGILSLVVGLGAQSLIKDIIAGIFIVFEGEFRVSDIVTVGGFRGTVLDIGLRTTKIMNAEGNIKIFNNSEISGVLNMTKAASIAACAISVEYGQDIEYVEAVLARELPKLQAKDERIMEAPKSLGVAELGESGVTFRVIAKCQEADVKSVSRFLNREVLMIFYRYNINVPFPNVTVSHLDTANRPTMKDFVPEEEGDDIPDVK